MPGSAVSGTAVPGRSLARTAALLVAAALAVVACSSGADEALPGSAGRTPRAAARAPGSPAESPSVPGSATAPAAPGTTRRQPSGAAVTIAFGGDVHFAGSSGARLAADPATAIGPMAATLRAADLAMVNLETAVTDRGTPAPKQYNFRAPASAFTALTSAGIDVATEANNHGMDYGVTGLLDSLAAARAANFPLVGVGTGEDAAFAPWRRTVKGQRIAVIGATQVLDGNLAAAWTAGPGKPGLASAKDEDRLVRAVRAARAGSDTVVVDLHWGRELASCPTEAQRPLARRLVQAGADVVVGSHAHVLLGGGWMGGAYVHYGLGNFVFYAGGGGPTVESGVLTLTVRGHAVTAARWTPGRISGGAARPLAGADADAARSSWERLRSCTGLASDPS